MHDYIASTVPQRRRNVLSVLVAAVVGVLVVAGAVAALTHTNPGVPVAGGATAATAGPALPTKEEARKWIAKAEAQLGYRVGDPCPAPDENAPPLADSPLMGMAGGEPCRIMFWITAQPDMPSVTVDGDGNVSPLFGDGHGGPDTTITAIEGTTR